MGALQYNPSIKRYNVDDLKKNVGHAFSMEQITDYVVGATGGVLLTLVAPSLLPNTVSPSLKSLIGGATAVLVGAIINSPAMVTAGITIPAAQWTYAKGTIPLKEKFNIDLFHIGDPVVAKLPEGGGTAGLRGYGVGRGQTAVRNGSRSLSARPTRRNSLSSPISTLPSLPAPAPMMTPRTQVIPTHNNQSAVGRRVIGKRTIGKRVI